MSIVSDFLESVDPIPSPPPAPIAALAVIPGLDLALAAAAPQADPARWLAPLTAALTAGDMTTPRRVAAFLGQCSVEAGPGFTEIVENLNYTHAARIQAVFPREFPDLPSAQACVGNPQALANRCYANRNGNGDEASGDGWRFCGRGLLQITGRQEYTAFATSIGMTPEAASDFVQTDAGAVASAVWYWNMAVCSIPADAWDIATVTRRINGSAMEGAAERLAASNAALAAMGAA